MPTTPRPAGGAVLAALLLAGGCKEHRFEPPPPERRVAEADSLYTPAAFDTVHWQDDAERLLAGNVVYAAKCRRCHGYLGEGGTEYARRNGLDVPSLVAPDWELADDTAAVRRHIFTGHTSGMPTWGIAGISPREIDAVTAYILLRLRPDALGGGAAGGTARPPTR